MPETASGSGESRRATGADPSGWVQRLSPDSAEREVALAGLHALLLRAARNELARRAPRSRLGGKEVDDLAHQCADDAMLAILRRLPEFRGDSRFTTWAYKFAILEVSSKLGRHFWTGRTDAVLDGEAWEHMPTRLGISPESAAEAADLLVAVRRSVDEALSRHQRDVFVALVVDGVPLDALAQQLATDRNTIYKTMFDARRKIRAALVTHGYLDARAGERR